MRKLTISETTMDLIRKQTLAGHTLKQTARLRPDGMWELRPDPEVMQRIDAQRLVGESDDVVVARIILAATSRKPH